MKTRLLIIGIVLIPFILPNVDASCEKNVGSADESCTPTELLEICDTLWSPRYDGSPTSGNIFCRVVYDLDLNEDDVRKLGIHLDWENYVMQSSKDFIDDWGFYQDHEIIPLPQNTWVIMPPHESESPLTTNQLDEMCRNGQALCQPRTIINGPNILTPKNNSEDMLLALLVGSIGISFILGIIY